MEGARAWLIPDGYLPAAGPPGGYQGHDAICVLNTGDADAHLLIDIYFQDHEPLLGIRVTVPARRTRHLRMDRPEEIAGAALPRETPYAARVSSDVPVTVQYSRLDVKQANLALMSVMAHPVEATRP